MFWSTLDFYKLATMLLPTFLRKPNLRAFLNVLVHPLTIIHQETMYQMQHNGSKISLEKVLNEAYNIAGYSSTNHEATKLIYIDDVPEVDKLYIWQELEAEFSFLEDDDNDNQDDLFLDGDIATNDATSWTVFMPDTVSFEEYKLRALLENYRYIGKKYNIEIYTP